MNQNNQNTKVEEAFQYLKSLPPYNHKGDKSQVIDGSTAQTYTDTFRSITDTFTIPISWNMDTAALINLLGITSYEGYSASSGIRFYAGINDNNQLTLIAVTTTDNTDGTDDLTVDDNYPYYDYANPCPNMCSNTGNLKATNVSSIPLIFLRSQ